MVLLYNKIRTQSIVFVYVREFVFGGIIMLLDEFIQKAPELCDIRIVNDIIYVRFGSLNIRDGSPAIKNTVLSKKENIDREVAGIKKKELPTSNALPHFLNCEEDKDWKIFISRFGLLDDTRISRECFEVKNAKRIEDFTPVALIKDYTQLQAEFKNAIEVCRLYDSKKIDSLSDHEWICFKKEEIEPLIDDVINDINQHCSGVSIRLERYSGFNFRTVINYPSLRHALYYLFRNNLTKTAPLKQCEREGCGKWFEYKNGKKYCSKDCAERVQRVSNNKRNEDVKQNVVRSVYKSVYSHFYDSQYKRRISMLNKGFNYVNWQDAMLDIKLHSSDFFADVDALCKKSCSCKYCKKGIASHFKKEYERKQGSPE